MGRGGRQGHLPHRDLAGGHGRPGAVLPRLLRVEYSGPRPPLDCAVPEGRPQAGAPVPPVPHPTPGGGALPGDSGAVRPGRLAVSAVLGHLLRVLLPVLQRRPRRPGALHRPGLPLRGPPAPEERCAQRFAFGRGSVYLRRYPTRHTNPGPPALLPAQLDFCRGRGTADRPLADLPPSEWDRLAHRSGPQAGDPAAGHGAALSALRPVRRPLFLLLSSIPPPDGAPGCGSRLDFHALPHQQRPASGAVRPRL